MILVSCMLPYDIARYEEADGIICAYGEKSISELPIVYNDIYKEIFNSDDVKFGGNKQSSNKRARKSSKGEWDGRQYFTKIDISKLSLIIFKYMGE